MDHFLGPIVLGSTAAYFLFGLTTQQTFMYFHYFPEDKKWMKSSVVLIWALDASLLFPLIYSVYNLAVTHFGDIEVLTIWFGWPLIVHNTLSVLIIAVVQLLYTYRLWCLGGGKGYSKYLCYTILIWILISSGMGYLMTYDISKTKLSDVKVLWSVKCGLAMSMVTDVVIAAAMCYYLQKSKSKFTNSRYNSKISKLMQYAVGSGVLTSAFSLASLIVYAVFPENLTFFGVICPYVTLYGLSYLTLLNARDSLRREDLERVHAVEKMPELRPSESSVVTVPPIRLARS